MDLTFLQIYKYGHCCKHPSIYNLSAVSRYMYLCTYKHTPVLISMPLFNFPLLKKSYSQVIPLSLILKPTYLNKLLEPRGSQSYLQIGGT